MNQLLRTALAGLSLFALILGLSVAGIDAQNTTDYHNHNGFGHWSRALSLQEVSDDSRPVLSESGLEHHSSQDPTDGGQRQASNLLQLDLDCEPVEGDDVFCAVVRVAGVDIAKLRSQILRGDQVRNLLHARSRSDFSRAPPQEQA